MKHRATGSIMTTLLATALCILASCSIANAEQNFFFISNFHRLVAERLDPIISPGAVSAHVHHVFGGNAFSPSMNRDTQASSSCTTGDIVADKSVYWNPALFWKAKNGSFIAAQHQYSRAYYEGRPVGGEKVYAFPPGFRMVAGNPFRRSEGTDNAAKAITWACAGGNVPDSQSIPKAQCPYGIRPQVGFPMCWDGMRIDSANHMDHVAYPTGDHQDSGPCPCSHPYKLPHLHVENYYYNQDIHELDDLYRQGQQPLVLANGDPTGYGFHGDFINGWDQKKLEDAVKTCTYNGFDESTANQCPLLAGKPTYDVDKCFLTPQVNEPVDGISLPALPGCNPLTHGPADAPMVQNCNVNPTTTGDFGSNVKNGDVYLALEKRPPKMAATASCPVFDNTGNAPSSSGDATSPTASSGSPPTATTLMTSMIPAPSSSTTVQDATILSTIPLLPPTGTSTTTTSGGSGLSAPTIKSSNSSVASLPTLPSGWSALGCYVDTLTPRSLPFWNYYHADVDSTSCAAKCLELGYKFAGSEYSGQCFCGNDLPATKAADGDCNMICKKAGSTEICGGPARLSVFGPSPIPTKSKRGVNKNGDHVKRHLRYGHYMHGISR